MIDINTKHGGTQLVDFLSALLSPLQTNTGLLKTFETQVTKEATWNGRKMVLQAALNDLFGITVAPFIIVEMNRSIGTHLFFYRTSEASPVYFRRTSENDPVYFFRLSEVGSADTDFTVKIPIGIWTTELERRVRAYTNLYKLVGPSFTIITY